MEIRIEKPPVWEEANKAFKLQKGVVFTYGNIIYNPDNIEISGDLMVHERTHARQQEYNETVAKVWWDRYLIDPAFRLEQEVAAYAAQYRYICAIVKDRNTRDRNLRALATFLSSPLYGCDITVHRAMECIKVGRLT